MMIRGMEMWKEFINSLSDEYEFQEPAKEKDIIEAEGQLDVELPHDLKELLKESNGILGEYRISIIWDIKRIVQDNLNFRNSSDFKELYMPFDCLLFFADAGNGDQFAYPILNGTISKDDIYVWNHEDDSRTWVASSLKWFIDGWSSGQIST